MKEFLDVLYSIADSMQGILAVLEKLLEKL